MPATKVATRAAERADAASIMYLAPASSAHKCERCDHPVESHHVGAVCIERTAAGVSGLPWALRAISLAATGTPKRT